MDVGRIKISMPGMGGHHVVLPRPFPGTLDWPAGDCPLTLNDDSWEVIAQSQHPDFDWNCPPEPRSTSNRTSRSSSRRTTSAPA
jgi:hypothetical protein